MNTYFQSMNEEYANKKYPNGSVFSASFQAIKKLGIGAYIFFGVLTAASGYGVFWGLMRVLELKKDGDSELAETGMIIVGFFAVVFLLSLGMIIFVKKRNSAGVNGVVKKSIQASKCSEGDIREFEKQATASDSYILNLVGKMKAVLNGQRDGILTRDYVYLADTRNIIIRIQDIAKALFVVRTFYIKQGDIRKPVDYLTVTLISKKGVEVFAESSKEAGEALLTLLHERNAEIDINGLTAISEKECTKILAK